MKKIGMALIAAALSTSAAATSSSDRIDFSYVQGSSSEIKDQRIQVFTESFSFMNYLVERGPRPAEESQIIPDPESYDPTRPYIAIHHAARWSGSLTPVKMIEKEHHINLFVEESYFNPETCITGAVSTPYTVVKVNDPIRKPVLVRFTSKVTDC